MRNHSEPKAEAAFLNVQNAAKDMGISVNVLYVWRHRRQGLPSFRMGPGGRVMYSRNPLDAWLAEQQQADSRSNQDLNPLNKAPQDTENRKPAPAKAGMVPSLAKGLKPWQWQTAPRDGFHVFRHTYASVLLEAGGVRGGSGQVTGALVADQHARSLRPLHARGGAEATTGGR